MRLLTLPIAVLAALVLAGPAAAQGDCFGDLNAPKPRTGGPRLVMGIYPGGLAGQIGAAKAPRPEDPARRLAALEQLRGDREFAVHLYVEFAGDGSTDADNARVLRELEDYMRRGYRGELVLTYRPVAKRGAPDAADFARFARGMVRRLGPNPRFHALQVTNEVNNALAADSSDGAYPGARDALIQGIIAAKDEARRGGHDRLEVGFNWFYRLDPSTENGFWTYLGAVGGRRFAEAVDWVGLDAYPGTFFPPAVPPDGERNSLANAFSVLRECFMPMAGLGKRVPLHVSENGYPTSPLRSYAQQERTLRTMVQAASDLRRNYNVTDYRWFDLRDGDSSDPDFGQQFGLMRDDYTPKPAFGAYRQLVSRLGVPRAPEVAAGARCLARRALVRRTGIAGVRIGRSRSAVRRRFGAPASSSRLADRFCVRGGGRVVVGYSRVRRVRLVSSTAPGHRARGRRARAVRRGSARSALKRAFPAARRVGPGLLRSGRLLVTVRRGRVGSLTALDGGLARRPRELRILLRRAGLR